MTGPMFDEDWIRPDGNGGVIIGTASPVPAEHISQLIAWIHEAAGKPNPIVLPRPSVGGCEVGPTWQVSIDRGHVVVESATILTPGSARRVAALIAATADLAESEPLTARIEVQRLAAFLDEQMDTDPETLARRLLGGFEVKERAA